VIDSSSGAIKFVTEDHKPDLPAEAERIRAAKGSVSFGRVDGDLAMSRSIGDWAYKVRRNQFSLRRNG
jgi:serine/threonine protein phosphatase PrpC